MSVVNNFLYTLGQLVLLHKITDKKIQWNSLKTYLAFVFCLIFAFLCSSSYFVYIRSILIVFLLIFMTKFLFSFSFMKTINVVFLNYFSNMIIEIILATCFFPFVGLDGFNNDLIIFIVQLLLIFSCYFLWNIFVFRKIKDDLLSMPSINSIFFVLFALVFYSFFTIYSIHGEVSPFIVLILSFIIITFLGISLFEFFLERSKYVEISKKYETLLEMTQDYEKMLEEQRMICHENKNQLLVLKSLIKEKKASSYIDTMINEQIIGVDSEYANNLSYLPFKGLSGLLYYKYFSSKKKNINMKLEVGKSVQAIDEENFSVNNISALLKIIGVFIDNALDEASISKIKEVDITLYKDKNQLFITIANSLSSKVDLSKGLEGTTSKGKNHGYGLLLVRKLLKEYNFIKNETEIISNVFIQKLEIDLTKMKG